MADGLAASSPFCSTAVTVTFLPSNNVMLSCQMACAGCQQFTQVIFCATQFEHSCLLNPVLQPQTKLHHRSWTDLLQSDSQHFTRTNLQHFSQTDLQYFLQCLSPELIVAHLTPAVPLTLALLGALHSVCSCDFDLTCSQAR